MSLTYEETSSLMNDATFRSRIKVACLIFADYILNETAATTAHNTRVRWATNTMSAPDIAAAAIAPVVVMDPNVQSQGSAISDPDLQTATETALNKMM